MIPAGSLNELITLQEKVVSRGSNGQEVITWTDYATNVPARIRPIRGREFVALRAAQSDLSMEITIRYKTGVNTTMRLLWNSDPYDIVEMIPGGRRNKTDITLMCRGATVDA
jgi:SPP1 family predicted phage head-tail adaptor